MRKWTLLTLLVLILALLAGCVGETDTTTTQTPTTTTPTTAPTTAPEPPPSVKNTCSVTLYNYDGTVIYTAELEKGASVDMSQVTVPEHPYKNWYTFTGWDKSLENVTEDLTATAQYDYNAIPDEAFEFVLLEDDTYGIRLIDDNKDYSYLNLEGYVGLPEEYNGKPVTRILTDGIYTREAATLFSNTTDVLVPSSYRIIEDGAFTICLNRLTVAEGVEEIWAEAFEGIYGPNYADASTVIISLPSTINFIEPMALHTKADIVLKNGDVYTYHEIRKEILTDGGHTLVWKNMTGIVNLTLEADITALYPGLFMGNYMLQSVTFKGEVKEIPTSTFYRCESLMEVNMQPGLEKIWGPEQIPELLKNMHSDNTLELLEGGAFGSCYNIAFELPETLTYLGDFAFYNTYWSSPITISANMEYVGLCAFANPMYGQVPSITVDPANTKYYSIDDCCLIERGTGINGGDRFMYFAPASTVTDFVVPDGVTSYDPFSFYGANNLLSLTIPEGVEMLPVAFLTSSKYNYNEDWTELLGIGGLEKLVLPASLKKLESGFDSYDEEHQFGGDTMSGSWFCLNVPGLKEVVFPNGNHIEIYEDFCWQFGENPIEFTFGAELKEFGALAVYGNNIRFSMDGASEKFVTINGHLFEKLGGNKLRLLSFANNPEDTVFDLSNLGDYIVTEIGPNAAGGNMNLTKIIIPDTVQTIAKEAFYNTPNVTDIVIGAGVTNIDTSAFYGCTNLLTLTFRCEKLPTLGMNVFYVEDWMNDVYGFPASVAITVPDGKYFDFYYSCYSIDAAMAKAIIAEGVATYDYTFVVNGGSEVDNILDTIFVYAPPYTEKEGYNLLGWYTKDGTNGDWGERIDFYAPYCAKADVTLYARWSDTLQHEDGSYFEFAYEMIVGEKRTITLADTGMGTYIFKFTADKTGLYQMPIDTGVIPGYSITACTLVDGKLREVEQCFMVTEATTMQWGYYVEAGQTVYLVATFYTEEYDNMGNVTGNANIFVPIEFEVVYNGEYTGNKWWEQ